MKNYLVKGLALNEQIRVYGIDAKDVVNQAQQKHDTYNGATIALGKTLLGGLLLGATLKGKDRLTLKIQGNGPLGTIVVDANGKGNTKGYVTHPHVYIQPDENKQPSLRHTVGTSGVLTVIKDLGLKEPFSGQVPLVSGEISQDLTYYMAVSEQVPSAINLSILLDENGHVKAAGGFMIQVLPNASEQSIQAVEQSLNRPLHFAKELANHKTIEQLLEETLHTPIQFLETMPVSFECDCSKEKFSRGILSLGKKEITEMIEQDNGAQAVCRFCNTKYNYSKEELETLLIKLEQEKEDD